MCRLVERLEQMAVAQMATKDADTLREAVGEIMRLRTEIEVSRIKQQGLHDSTMELLGAIERAGWVRD